VFCVLSVSYVTTRFLNPEWQKGILSNSYIFVRAFSPSEISIQVTHTDVGGPPKIDVAIAHRTRSERTKINLSKDHVRDLFRVDAPSPQRYEYRANSYDVVS